jgi:hypothetical protein
MLRTTGPFSCRADPGTAHYPVLCHLGHQAETISTAQHANRAVLAQVLLYRAGPGFVLSNSCRARAGTMGTAQTNRTNGECECECDPFPMSDRFWYLFFFWNCRCSSLLRVWCVCRQRCVSHSVSHNFVMHANAC